MFPGKNSHRDRYIQIVHTAGDIQHFGSGAEANQFIEHHRFAVSFEIIRDRSVHWNPTVLMRAAFLSEGVTRDKFAARGKQNQDSFSRHRFCDRSAEALQQIM